MDSITKGMVAPDRKIRTPFVASSDQIQMPEVKFGTHTSACHFAPVDHAGIARACGCGATTVSAPGDLGTGLGEALAARRPWLIEVMTDPAAHPPLSLFDGTLDHQQLLGKAV